MMNLLYYLVHPMDLMERIVFHCAPYIKSDSLYIKLQYFFYLKKWLHLKNPITLNEKIQWLKLNDRKPEYTEYVDKYKVKELLEREFGTEYIIPTYGVWEKFDDIDFSTLPEKFVMKTTNGGGGNLVVICRDKSKLDMDEVRKKMEISLKSDIYTYHREWPYKDVKPLIIAEKLLENADGSLPDDYKLNYFNGNLEFIYTSYDRQGVNDRVIYDPDWNKLPFMWQHGTNKDPNKGKSNVPCPKSFEKMKEFGAKIASRFKYVRVDLYDVDGHLYFGEITFYHGSGLDVFTPEKYDRILGEKLKLGIE